MNSLEAFLEKTWEGILSRETKRIQSTYLNLDENNRRVVLAHLKKMVSEDGWHAEQVKSAQAALNALALLDKE